jgi:hypothetical protein
MNLSRAIYGFISGFMMLTLMHTSAQARDLPTEATSWRRVGSYTFHVVSQLQDEHLANKKRWGSPHKLGNFSRKINLELRRDGSIHQLILLSSSYTPLEDKVWLRQIRRLKFPPLPGWYKGTEPVTLPLDVRHDVKMVKLDNEPEFPIVSFGIYFIDDHSENNGGTKSSTSNVEFNGSGSALSPGKPIQELKLKGVISYDKTEEGSGPRQRTPEQIKEAAMNHCKFLGVRGPVTLRVLADMNGYEYDFELLEATETPQKIIDLFNLTYRCNVVAEFILRKHQEFIFKLDVPSPGPPSLFSSGLN